MARRKSTGPMVPNCPSCQDWHDDTRGHISRFRMADGSVHAAPDMWLASRAGRIEREIGCDPLEAFGLACGAWTEQCALHAQFEAEQSTTA